MTQVPAPEAFLAEIPDADGATWSRLPSSEVSSVSSPNGYVHHGCTNDQTIAANMSEKQRTVSGSRLATPRSPAT